MGGKRTCRALQAALIVAAVACGIPPAAGAATRCPGAGLSPLSATATTIDEATLCLINRTRVAHHLDAVSNNRQLGAVATAQVRTMVRMDYFSHVRPTGQTPMAVVRSTHYPARAASLSVGEVIAWGSGSYATPAHIFAEWMASPGHRAVILTPEFRDAGVAFTNAVPGRLGTGGAGSTYAVEFGVRRR